LSTFEAIVLGIVQGFTEFLPISSTAHLRIVPAFAGWEDPGTAFTAVIQLGTVLAVVVYFRHDLWNITRAWLASLRDPSRRSEQDARMGWYLIAGTIPIAVIGFAFSDTIESKTRDLYLIGSTLIALGLVLLAAEKMSKHERKLESTTMRDAVAIGFGQAAALIPGVSRSGSTITVGLFLGFDREAAARLSFLLSVPAVVLSGLYQLGDALDADQGIDTLLISTFFAFVSGYLAIAGLLRFLVNHSTIVFVVYRVALGVLVLVLAGTGVIE
jgi:undecaprenyl-diphosphatase